MEKLCEENLILEQRRKMELIKEIKWRWRKLTSLIKARKSKKYF